MKRFNLVWIAALLLAGCAAAVPQIELETERLVLGDVVNGEVVTREVAVYNRGGAELAVAAIVTSCGCTTATLEPMAIPAGGSGVLRIEFDSGAHGPELAGELVRQVFIASDDPARPEVMLEIEAFILPPAQP